MATQIVTCAIRRNFSHFNFSLPHIVLRPGDQKIVDFSAKSMSIATRRVAKRAGPLVCQTSHFWHHIEWCKLSNYETITGGEDTDFLSNTRNVQTRLGEVFYYITIRWRWLEMGDVTTQQSSKRQSCEWQASLKAVLGFVSIMEFWNLIQDIIIAMYSVHEFNPSQTITISI